MQRLGPTKKRKRKCSECVKCFGHWTVFIRWTESGLCTRDGWLEDDPLQRSQIHPTNLFLSLKSVMQRLGPTKKRKRKCSECVKCFGHWTVFIRWTESGLCTRDGWLEDDPLQRSQIHPTNLFLSLKSVMQRLGPTKKRKRKCSECVKCFGHWTVFIRWTESGLCTGDWEDMNDKRRSVFYRKIIFCTTGSFSGCLSLRC